jgi:ubiquinone/menaquinone biosynthesis C-methylase UbiE
MLKSNTQIGSREDKMIIEMASDLKGSILDVGGGGEAVIGQVYGDRVTAIDNRQEELDEAPNCCTKLLMDAEELSFADGSFDNVTFFYTLMYMTNETQMKAIWEAARVLKVGGTMCIWDCTIPAAYPDPFVVDLDIQFVDKRILTSYGIIKTDTQSSDSIIRFLENAGLNIVSLKEESGQFIIMCRKD